ncbi:hypothetical protein Y032_0130g1558 [Ancylostoma ceylanicum]|uniref:Uncharacterized protein n=1 Tax=Ancylostoma ceylanicum TaxID=53326 RepID=A0A016T7J2_9BILA|nr:hypothetical protein Y032_0130g1558 [Ancylostoma ceylanicum]
MPELELRRKTRPTKKWALTVEAWIKHHGPAGNLHEKRSSEVESGDTYISCSCSTHCGQLDLHGASRPFVPVSPRDFAFMEAHYSCDVACTVGVAGGDSVAASKSTWSERAAQARILSGATNCEVFLTIRHCSTDSSVSGAVATRSFRGRGWVAAIDAHCTYIQSEVLSVDRIIH